MLKQLEFGSLRYGGAETKISVGDTDPMQTTIQWAWYKGLMVQSHQIVCPGWPGEESPKLLTGLPVEVDGFPFICRIPVLPDDQDVIKAVDWGSYPFWCCNPKTPNQPHMCEPRAGAKVSQAAKYDVRCMLRLIMEPVPVAPNPLVGKPVKFLFQPYVLRGWLDGFTDYDLVCRITEDTHISPDWGVRKGDKVYIDREAVMSLAPI